MSSALIPSRATAAETMSRRALAAIGLVVVIASAALAAPPATYTASVAEMWPSEVDMGALRRAAAGADLAGFVSSRAPHLSDVLRAMVRQLDADCVREGTERAIALAVMSLNLAKVEQFVVAAKKRSSGQSKQFCQERQVWPIQLLLMRRHYRFPGGRHVQL